MTLNGSPLVDGGIGVPWISRSLGRIPSLKKKTMLCNQNLPRQEVKL
jgi:hypothetical protein